MSKASYMDGLLFVGICLGCFALGKCYEAETFTPDRVTSCTDDYTTRALNECTAAVNESITALNDAGKLVNALVDFIWTAECIDLKIIQEEPRPEDMTPLPRYEDRVAPKVRGTNHPSGELY